MIIYDIEIVKAIKNKNDQPIEGIKYCDGWQDHANMGVSVIGCYDYNDDRYRVFCEDNFSDFAELIESDDTVVGFNSIAFDNAVIHASTITEIPRDKSYDILVEIWHGAGLSENFKYPSHVGFGLDACCLANFGTRKSGHGAMAPVDWQRGKIGSVIDYCLNDVKLTKQLLDLIIERGEIIDPRNHNKTIKVRKPKNA